MRRLLPPLFLLVACDRFDVALGPTKPPKADAGAPVDAATPSPIGLDARPVTSCKAVPKNSVPSGMIGFERIPTVGFASPPVELTVHDQQTYILELGGRVIRTSGDRTTLNVALDVTSTITSGGEAGLLGIAFHPSFATNGFVYLYYTVPHPTQPPPGGVVFQSALVRYHSNDNGLTFDPASAKRIMTIDQPYANHNGGTIAFGKDGFLYWGLGDGGSGGDPGNRAQNKNVLLGKMLRIDVDGGDPYVVPATNPFGNEIYALGLRNPYRWRFDDVTGDLWVGDVGQSAREEIDKVALGGNYGWNIREGKTCYSATTCDATGLIDPIVDHPRDEATTIIGGVVYRGTGVPALTGKYVYADIGLKTFWTIPIDDPSPTPVRIDDGGGARPLPSAIAIDDDGEILVLDYSASGLYKIVPGSLTAPPEMPESLRATGCLDGLFPYDVNVPQWMDGAVATRSFAIPADGVMRGGPDGQLALPAGSVVVKTLKKDDKPIETQLLLHRTDKTWDAYSYLWDGDDAKLQTSAQTCTSCHNPDAGVTLGLEAAQLDKDDVDFGNGHKGNPLATLTQLQMIDVPVPATAYTKLKANDGPSYLHANCSSCHRATPLDLRFESRNACADLVVGKPDESKLVLRMRSADGTRMPPVGSSLVDDAGVAAVSGWISGLASCP